MFADVIHFTQNNPECAVITGDGKPSRPVCVMCLGAKKDCAWYMAEMLG